MTDRMGYTIGVVSRLVGISPQMIRMYEQRGMLKPGRSTGNTRLYTDEDIEILKMIQRLTRELGVNLSGVEIIIRLNQVIRQLQNEREQLMKMLMEAGEMMQSFLRSETSDTSLVKSSLGVLVKYLDFK